MILRQGDLTFLRIGDATPDAPTTTRSVKLAEGELSGHWHEVTGATVDRVDGRYVVNVPGPTPAVVRVQPESHAGRHEPIELAPGTYEVPGVPSDDSIWIGQAEYSPAAIIAAGD